MKIRNTLVRDLARTEMENPEAAFFGESTIWAKEMQSKYPDTYNKVRSYHVMIGSTPPHFCAEEDFSGEDSALVFMEKLRQKYELPE